MTFAKLDNGVLRIAPRKIKDGASVTYNPTPETLLALGYKPMRYTDPPEAPEGYTAVPGWEEQANAIVQTWTLQELPPEEASAEELVEILLGGAT